MTNPDGTPFLSSRARAQSTEPLRWHTDRTDVVGLLCVGEPAEGGTSRLASAVAIHDEMVRRRPDLAALLYETIWRSRLGEETGGADSIYGLPVFTVTDGKFASHYSRTYVEAAQKLEQTPKMTPAQWEALDMLASLGEEFCYEMELEAGDMQFLNNHVVYHARSAFRDDPATGRIREPVPHLAGHAQQPPAAGELRDPVRAVSSPAFCGAASCSPATRRARPSADRPATRTTVSDRRHSDFAAGPQGPPLRPSRTPSI